MSLPALTFSAALGSWPQRGEQARRQAAFERRVRNFGPAPGRHSRRDLQAIGRQAAGGRAHGPSYRTAFAGTLETKMNAAARHLLRIFVTGALAALPLVATIAIFTWAARTLYGWIGPDSLVGSLLTGLGLGIIGSGFAGYVFGCVIVVTSVFALGVAVRTRWRGVLQNAVDRAMARIPLVRNVYDLIRRFVDMLSKRDAAGTRGMSPVWLYFGGAGQAAVLGLLSTPEPVLLGGEPYLGVLVPTAPVPVGGGLLFVPQHWVTPAEVGMDGLTSIYVSMGVTAHQHLGPAVAAGVPGGVAKPTPGSPQAAAS